VLTDSTRRSGDGSLIVPRARSGHSERAVAEWWRGEWSLT